MQFRQPRIELDKEMDRLLELEKHCLTSLEKTNDDKIQKELLDVLDSIQRQKNCGIRLPASRASVGGTPPR